MKGMGVKSWFCYYWVLHLRVRYTLGLQSGFVKGYKIKTLSLIMLICYE